MKKLYIVLIAVAISALGYAQDYSEDFESYSPGDYIGVESDQWTTWSGNTGSAEDAQITSDLANSGTNSIYFEVQGTSGPQDVVLLFDGKHTEDLFNFSAYFYIPSGNSAYFNFQAEETIGVTWAIDVYMNDDASLAVSSGGNNHVLTTYPNDQWFKVEFNINLTINNWKFLVDDVVKGEWFNEVNAVAMVDFFPATANDLFYIDDVAFSVEEFVLPDLNAAVLGVNVGVIGIVGQERNPVITIGNVGSQEITEYVLSYEYNGVMDEVTLLNLSLGSLEKMEFSMPEITLAEGENELLAYVSNVNGLGQDDVPEDDSSFVIVNPVVAAPGRIVIAEEGTGTWCGWCPRGTVAMDFMAGNYEGYYYGIAVHNGDPMVVPEYDDALGFSAFPGAMVDRTDVIDPANIEFDFVNRVEMTPLASITTGAQWNGDALMISLTYSVIEEIAGNYKVVCVLTEDGVSGTSGSWAQANNYSGGATPMGGFENLPNPVPASVMVYDHVARVASPFTNGYENAFPDGGIPGEGYTFNFTIPIPEDWNPDNMHIVGMLLEPNGEINNGGGSTIDQAISNGYVEGTVVVGIEELSHIVSNFEVYPNPAQNQANINLDLKSDQQVSLKIIDLSGKVILSKNYGRLNGTYDLPIGLNGIESGVYFVNLLIGDQAITQKLIVE